MDPRFDQLRQRLAGRPTQRIEDPGAGRASVAIILALGAGEVEALFIRRAIREGDPWSGQIALPGGRRDQADPDLLTTATRETLEEVGIKLGPHDLLGELDDVHPRTRRLPRLVVRPFAFAIGARPAVRASGEIASYHWISLGELLHPGNYRQTMIPEVARPFPAYHVSGLVVWGMTERIITPFLHLVQPIVFRGGSV